MSRTKRHETRRGEQSGERKREREGKGRTIGDKIVSLKRLGEERGARTALGRRERYLSSLSRAQQESRLREWCVRALAHARGAYAANNIPRRDTTHERERGKVGRERERADRVLQAKEPCYAVAMVVTEKNGAPCGH